MPKSNSHRSSGSVLLSPFRIHPPYENSNFNLHPSHISSSVHVDSFLADRSSVQRRSTRESIHGCHARSKCSQVPRVCIRIRINTRYLTHMDDAKPSWISSLASWGGGKGGVDLSFRRSLSYCTAFDTTTHIAILYTKYLLNCHFYSMGYRFETRTWAVW